MKDTNDFEGQLEDLYMIVLKTAAASFMRKGTNSESKMKWWNPKLREQRS